MCSQDVSWQNYSKVAVVRQKMYYILFPPEVYYPQCNNVPYFVVLTYTGIFLLNSAVLYCKSYSHFLMHNLGHEGHAFSVEMMSSCTLYSRIQFSLSLVNQFIMVHQLEITQDFTETHIFPWQRKYSNFNREKRLAANNNPGNVDDLLSSHSEEDKLGRKQTSLKLTRPGKKQEVSGHHEYTNWSRDLENMV